MRVRLADRAPAGDPHAVSDREPGHDTVTPAPPERAPASIPRLQQSAGNRAVTALLQREPKTGTAPPPVAGAAAVDEVWNRLAAFERDAAPQLKLVGERMDRFQQGYDAGYAEVTRRLEKAKKDREVSPAWGVLMGIVIGVGVGLAAGEFFAACKTINEIVELFGKEAPKGVIGESTEAGVGAVLSPPESKVDYTIPADAGNDRVARDQEHQLRKAWEAVGMLGAAGYTFSPRRDALRAAPASMTAADVASLGRLSRGLAQADQAFKLFIASFDTPLLDRSPKRIEADIWIRWMSQSQENAQLAASDDIGGRMREVGVFAELEDPSGWLSDPLAASRQEVESLKEVGHIGVVVVPPHDEQPGVVHMRADAYQAAGRRQPPAAGQPEYALLPVQRDQFFRSGDVVMLTDTSPELRGRGNALHRAPGFVAKRMNATLAVDAAERAGGLAFAGRPASYYPAPGSETLGQDTRLPETPDRAEPVIWTVRNAVERMRRTPPPIVRVSEDGVLVCDPGDGTPLVLFTVYISYGEAMASRGRTGARTVVAVDIDPNSQMNDWGSGGFRAVRKLDEAAVTAYIIAEDAALDPRPKLGPGF